MTVVIVIVVVMGTVITYTIVLINSGISPITVGRRNRYYIARGNYNEIGRI